MWFHLGFQNFIAKKNFNVDSCDIFISDFTHIWHKSLSDNELRSISQLLNPLLEVSTQKLRDITLNSIEDVKTHKEIKTENNNIFFKLESNILGLKFRFHVLLDQGSTDMFYRELTVPLLIMLISLQNKEKQLIKIIEDKDAEIAEYKQQYGKLKSSFLTTKPFSEKEFQCQNTEANIFLDSSSFLHWVGTKLLSKIDNNIPLQSVIENTEEKFAPEMKNDPKQAVFKEKSLNQKIGSTPCVRLEYQTIKKSRKHIDPLKIKF